MLWNAVLQWLISTFLSSFCLCVQAYRLSAGLFAQEAVDQLVDLLTQDSYRGKMVVILAGYTEQIDQLLRTANPGLRSRFTGKLEFAAFQPDDCTQLLRILLGKDHFDLPDGLVESLRPSWQRLCGAPNFASGRDVETLAKAIVQTMLSRDDDDTAADSVSPDQCTQLRLQDVAPHIEAMAEERQPRQVNDAMEHSGASPPAPTHMVAPPAAAPASAAQLELATAAVAVAAPLTLASLERVREAATVVTHSDAAEANDHERGHSAAGLGARAPLDALDAQRDAGVSDACWAELERAKQRRRAEEARLKAAVQAARDQAERAAALAEQARRLQLEQQIQAKLARMGVCPAGYQWLPVQGGWLCAGGAHLVTDAQLGLQDSGRS